MGIILDSIQWFISELWTPEWLAPEDILFYHRWFVGWWVFGVITIAVTEYLWLCEAKEEIEKIKGDKG